MSQYKLFRNYQITIDVSPGVRLTFGLPFTMEFNITRSSLASVGLAQIRLFNLSENNRNLLRYDYSNNYQFKLVTLRAGYGDKNLPVIFRGNIIEAWSLREGVDFVTTITCQDGGSAVVNAKIPEGEGNFPANTPKQTILKTLMGYLQPYGVDFGKIGNSFIYDSGGNLIKTDRSSSYVGDVFYNLNQITGNAFFVDNNKSYVLKNSEYSNIQGPIPLINADSGLLNTPLLEIQLVTFDMIFEPSLYVGQLIELDSQTFQSISSSALNPITNKTNGKYKTTAIKHRGTISTSICGDAITTVQFQAIEAALGVNT